MTRLFQLAICFLPAILAAPAPERVVERAATPTVALSYASVTGSTSGNIQTFNGIPFAQPPVGQLRLKPPQSITSNLGSIQATGTAKACPQFIFQENSSSVPDAVLAYLLDTPLFQTILDEGEDCLTLNVQRPSTATATSKLPVLFWIYGGGFELGSTSMYDGSSIVSTSISQSKDIIFVEANYRVGGFGFMPGSEILADGSANLGLLDQRLALEWVADNIAKFGGDPTKVTIWGESAGSISVFDQMALYNGNITYKGQPLFRGGIMDSGSIVPAEPIDGSKGQGIYNTVVKNAGCAGASDTLACLRSLDYETFLAAANSVPNIVSYTSIALSYLPRPDGVVLTQSPEILAASGLFASVPFIIGDQQDEGTLFSLFVTNITNSAELVDYLATVFFPSATVAQVQGLVDLYPDDPSAGSPYGTGDLWNIYPEYKRLASILGDASFTLTRRAFLNLATAVHPSVPSWSYLATYGSWIPILGTFHFSDVLPAFGITPGPPETSIQSYYISFVNTLNPNTGTSGQATWPQYSVANELMTFNLLDTSLTVDNFRSAAYDYITSVVSAFRV